MDGDNEPTGRRGWFGDLVTTALGFLIVAAFIVVAFLAAWH